MSDEGGHGKRKANEDVEAESSRQRKAINSNHLSNDPYANARQVFLDDVDVPAEFMCALSETIMSDPVNLSTGQTVDRSAFEKLFDVMPDDLIDQVTGIENLSSAVMTPNVELRTWIKNWHEDRRKAELRFQLKMLSYSPEYQIASARELRLMVKDFPSYGKAFVDLGPSGVLDLVRPLLADNLLTHSPMHEDILITATRLSKCHPGNRKLLGQHETVIYLILDSLRRGSLQSRLSALALVCYITAVPSCRGAFVRSGIIEHLSDLLKSGIMLVMNHALGALCEICKESEYRLRVIKNGVIETISSCLSVEDLSEKYARLLNQLSLDKVGLLQLAGSLNIHNWLLNTVRNTNSSIATESCLLILSRILPISEAAFATTLEHEMKYHIITKVVSTGTPRNKQAARVILKSLQSKQNFIGEPSYS